MLLVVTTAHAPFFTLAVESSGLFPWLGDAMLSGTGGARSTAANEPGEYTYVDIFMLFLIDSESIGFD